MSSKIVKEEVIVRALGIIDDLNFLRHEEGDTVTILCMNPEADYFSSQTGVDVCGGWTGWKEKRFLASTWGTGVQLAAKAKRKYEEGLK